MNFLILGDGAEERSWARDLDDRPGRALEAACPGWSGEPAVARVADLDEALARPGVDAALVGGPSEFRAEALRRAAAEGLALIVLHPPGENADPYYHVALSGLEAGAVLVPDLPLRRHPGVSALRAALDGGALGEFRAIRYEATIGPDEGDLLGRVFPKVVDAVRDLLGEVEAVNAAGDPPGERPSSSLFVHLRGPGGRRGEVRLEAGTPGRRRLVVQGAGGAIAFEHDGALQGPSSLVRTGPDGAAGDAETLPAWDARGAILDALDAAVAGRPAGPTLLDGTRAMELTEAVARSLRRGRTVDLLYEEMTELGNFKSVMTGLGCGLLVVAMLILPLAMAGPALGMPWTLYLPRAIPFLLVLFVVLQALRLLVRPPRPAPTAEPDDRAP